MAERVGMRDPVPRVPRRRRPRYLHHQRDGRAQLCQLRKAINTKGSFPNKAAARKLVYLATQTGVPQWTRTRTWTPTLLAFTIHFGDPAPDTAH
jgi:transposase-like protein